MPRPRAVVDIKGAVIGKSKEHGHDDEAIRRVHFACVQHAR
jgi:hypothetical protein